MLRYMGSSSVSFSAFAAAYFVNVDLFRRQKQFQVAASILKVQRMMIMCDHDNDDDYDVKRDVLLIFASRMKMPLTLLAVPCSVGEVLRDNTAEDMQRLRQHTSPQQPH